MPFSDFKIIETDGTASTKLPFVIGFKICIISVEVLF